jgi:hypothetical protein
LSIRKAYNRRQIAVLKNRFGPETARPMQLELEPTTVTLRPCPHAETLTAVARGYLPGVGITEVQGAVTLPRPGSPARVVAPGLPRKEIDQYLSGICQIEGFELADFDLSIQCRLPGERRYRGVLGLPLCIALAASYIQKPIPEHHVYLGEINLCRNVRDVPPPILDDFLMSLEMAESTQPFKVLGPPSAAARLAGFEGIETIVCRKLEEAFFHTWPELRRTESAMNKDALITEQDVEELNADIKSKRMAKAVCEFLEGEPHLTLVTGFRLGVLHDALDRAGVVGKERQLINDDLNLLLGLHVYLLQRAMRRLMDGLLPDTTNTETPQ